MVRNVLRAFSNGSERTASDGFWAICVLSALRYRSSCSRLNSAATAVAKSKFSPRVARLISDLHVWPLLELHAPSVNALR